MRFINNLFKKKPKRKTGTSEIIYEANGIRLYGWPQMEMLPAKRYLAYILAANDGELGITRMDLLAYVKGISDSYEANLHTKVGWYIETLRFYLEEYPPEKIAFKMITPLIRLEGEPEEEILDEFEREKAKLYDNNLQVRAFFLSYGFDLLSMSSVLSTDIEKKDFIRISPSKNEKMYSKLTGNDTYTDYLSK